MLHLGFSCRFPVHQHRVIFYGAFHHIIPPLYTTTNTILPSASAALLSHTRFCPATSPILFSFCNVTNSSFCPFSSLHHFQLFSHTSGFLFFTRLAQGSLMKCSRSSCQKSLIHHFLLFFPVNLISIQESNLNSLLSFRTPGYSTLRSDYISSWSGSLSPADPYVGGDVVIFLRQGATYSLFA